MPPSSLHRRAAATATPFVLLLLLVACLLPAAMSIAGGGGPGSTPAAAVPPQPAAPASSSSSSSSDCPIGEDVALSSRRCAGARFLYKDVVQVRCQSQFMHPLGIAVSHQLTNQPIKPKDPLAELLAGEEIIASERVNQAKNAVYPVVAIRTRWMDERIRAALAADPSISQVMERG